MKKEKSQARVLIVMGHGRTSGLCHRLAAVVRETLESEGVAYRVHDLLADGFDPILRLTPEERNATPCAAGDDPVAHRYQEDVRWADAYVIVHPVWWFAPPAILKGWVDRILVHDVAISQEPGGPPQPLLTGRRALLVQTFNVLKTIDRVLFRGLTEAFWKRAVFLPVGIRGVKRFALYSVESLTETRLAAQEKRLRRAVMDLLEI